MKFAKIQDKEANLEVKGQGCWDDCYVGPHVEGETTSSYDNCIWIPDWTYTPETWYFW